MDRAPHLFVRRAPCAVVRSRSRDVFLQGDCDDGVRRLVEMLGWEATIGTLLELLNSGDHVIAISSMRTPIAKQPIRLTTSVPHGKTVPSKTPVPMLI